MKKQLPRREGNQEKVEPTSEPTKCPADIVAYPMPASCACVVRSLVNSSTSKISFAMDKLAVNSAEMPAPHNASEMAHKLNVVGKGINGTGPMSRWDAIVKVPPIMQMTIPIPFFRSHKIPHIIEHMKLC